MTSKTGEGSGSEVTAQFGSGAAACRGRSLARLKCAGTSGWRPSRGARVQTGATTFYLLETEMIAQATDFW